jgi:nucleotide sugar dehydrogenase
MENGLEQMKKNKIGIVGAGFVGTACEVGFSHISESKIYDKYKDTESLQSVVEHADVIFICVPTPTDFETGQCDVSIVRDVCMEIASLADDTKCIVIKSTVPPQTTDMLQKLLPKHVLVFNPEFLTEKNFINDFKDQDRIILGTTALNRKTKAYNQLLKLYLDFKVNQEHYVAGMYETNIVECTSSEAEMLKYVSNTFLATKVAFFNEIYEICKNSEIKYDNVVQMLQYDSRIGTGHTKVPGPDGQFGFSGKCFPKDLNALMFFAKENGVDPLVLESVWSKNLLVRDDHDWVKIPGASTENMNFGDDDDKNSMD